jgi:hypothetical protein
MRARCSSVVVLIIASVTTTALAQSERTTAAVVLADGIVSLDDRPLDAVSLPSVWPENVLLRTERGRAAIALRGGSWLFLDAGASARVLDNRTYNFNRIEVLAGSAIVASGTGTPLVDCEREVRLSTAGIFRFDVRRVDAGGERPCRIRVYDGSAAVQLMTVTNALRAGEAMSCSRRCGDMIPTTEFPPDQLDELDRWARASYERLRN